MKRRILVPGFGRRVGVVLACIALATQLGLVSTIAWGAANPSLVRDWLVVGKVAEAQTLDGYVAAAGISSAGRFYLFAAKPTLHTPDTFDEACPVREIGIAVLGCFDEKTGVVHLLDIADDTLSTMEPVVAAHEMLHSVWERLDLTEKAAISREIGQTVAAVTDPELTAQLHSYATLPATDRDRELFAVLGTEVNTVTPALEAVYDRYFDNRQDVVVLAATSATVISTIMTSVEETAALVAAKDHIVATKRKAYQSERKALTHDITVFNAHANTKGYYQSKSRFTADKNALERRQAALEKKRLALNEIIRAYNELVDKLAGLNAQAMTLNRALGIDASALAPVKTEP